MGISIYAAFQGISYTADGIGVFSLTETWGEESIVNTKTSHTKLSQ